MQDLCYPHLRLQVLVLAMVHEYLEGLAGAEVQVVAVLAQVNEDGFHDGLADRRLNPHHPSNPHAALAAAKSHQSSCVE